VLEKNHQDYRDKAEFVFVYIREAHPADSNWGDGTGILDPRDLTQRTQVATKCSSELGLGLPLVVDDMTDTVNMLYRAWPERIYVIDRAGRIAHKSGIGPWGFAPAKAMLVLDRLLAAGKR
jgi:hypothetical protein